MKLSLCYVCKILPLGYTSTEERVGCFIIGLSRLRSDLESHNRSYWDRLLSSLKDSIAVDVVKLQQYVDESTGVLNRQPLTMEQIGETDVSYTNVLKDKPEVSETFCVGLNRT